jgi:hypothetical protein
MVVFESCLKELMERLPHDLRLTFPEFSGACNGKDSYTT